MAKEPSNGDSGKSPRKQRREAEARIIAKARRDPSFREALLKNPKEAIEAEFGVDLADELQFTVVQESFYHRYLVLPEPLEKLSDDEELTDDDLASVAGRMSAISYVNRDEIGR